MNEEQVVISHRMRGVNFGLYSSSEIKKLSVKEITNPHSFDLLNHPTIGGLYDPALGALENQSVCATCGQSHAYCPGHMGHISLPLPAYNPFLFKILYQLLQCTCFHCHSLLAKRTELCVFQKQMTALDHGLISIVESLQDIYTAMVVERGGEKGILDELSGALDTSIEAALLEKKTIGGNKSNRSDDTSHPQVNIKNVVAWRQGLVNEFFRTKGFRGKSCAQCGQAIKQLKTEHNNKFFFPKKKIAATSAQKKKKQDEHREAERRKPHMGAQEDQDDIETVQEVGNEGTPHKETETGSLAQQEYLTPLEACTHMQAVWQNNSEELKVVLGSLGVKMQGTECPLDAFFLDVLPVPPLRFRPLVRMQDKIFENQQTANYSRVLNSVVMMLEILSQMQREEDQEIATSIAQTQIQTIGSVKGDSLKEKLHNTWLHLQTTINCVVDSDLDKLSTDKQPGIKQLLEKKEGLFRKHMMGKRVDYAARSVISPDPYINTDEIGVPLVFATKLTFPQPVTPWNFHELKQAVINGPDVHPGATHVENELGRKIRLQAKDATQRDAIAKQLLTPGAGVHAGAPNKKVYRHIKNGDVLLLNRQPTLHRPSIQAHKARILPGEKTLRLHYANCKAYNADFDGDEMNAHFPQNEICRAEAYHLASTNYQYLVPKDGTPLAGLIQDHMVGGVKLSMRGRHFTREDYQQLVYAALTDKTGPVRQLPPCMLKPQLLWSGKQVMSTVILNIIPKDKPALNLVGKSKIVGKISVPIVLLDRATNWQNGKQRPLVVESLPIHGDNMGESEVIIRQGELLVGVLDKGHYGNTPYGLVHCCYELYGGGVAGQLLTCLAKLFTAFLQWNGFTLGVESILVTPKADSKRRKLIKKARKSGADVAAKAFGMDEQTDHSTLWDRLQQAHLSRDDGDMKDLDLAMKGKTDEIMNDIVKVIMPQGLEMKFPHNNLQLMVQSGAKGSSVNCMQISCLLGQIELEGRRPPLMMSGAALPSFLPYNTSPRAGGFVDGRFLTGIRPQEYFYHCMAGREGLVDTAVKTSRSGYLQRCLIKHMEGLTVNYDLTVRDSDGSVVQFCYGEDGIDVLKTQFLKPQQFPFLISNQQAVLSECHLANVQSKLDCTEAPLLWKQFKKWKSKVNGNVLKYTGSAFHKFVKKNSDKVLGYLSEKERHQVHEASGRTIPVKKFCEIWGHMEDRKKEKYRKYQGHFPDPVLARLQPDRHFGAVSERFEAIIDDYFSKNPNKLIHIADGKETVVHPSHVSAEKFRNLLYLNSLQALAQPGEGIGLLAAQSIGEPSTQMTLNTFHFAGRGEMNVTLGIPRLREILMVASANIRTPTMDIPLLDTEYAHQHSKLLKHKLNRVYLSQVLEEVVVAEKIVVKDRRNKYRSYGIKFCFLPHAMYREEYHVTPSSILHYMERKFLKSLASAIRRRTEELHKCSLLSTARQRDRITAPAQAAGNQGNDDDDDDDVLDDDLNEGDSIAARNRQRQLDEQDYEGEEEEKQELGQEEEESDALYSSESEFEELMVESEEGSRPCTPETAESLTLGSEVNTPSRSKKKKKKDMDLRRINGVLSSVNSIHKYTYDAMRELWCEATYQYPLSHAKLDMSSLVETVAKKMVVYETPGIGRCFLSQSKRLGEEGVTRMKTEGINILEIYKYNRILDLNKLYTNDIHAIAATYGIEAAFQVIIKEIRDVFAAYGIDVDYRHLSLVADYMTFEGAYKAFNRVGLETNASPIQKMTFETTMHFLKSATVMGAQDDLQSPSARLVVGRVALSGTGCFDILQPLK